MSWQTNKKILLAIFVVNMTIALAWAMLGAWMILPFAGLEIFLVGLGMYYVSWKLNFKEIIVIEADSMTIQKGVYFPKQEWRWQKSQTSLLKQSSKYRMSAPNLYLAHLDEQVEVASFLNRTEKLTVRTHLNQLGVPTITLSSK